MGSSLGQGLGHAPLFPRGPLVALTAVSLALSCVTCHIHVREESVGGGLAGAPGDLGTLCDLEVLVWLPPTLSCDFCLEGEEDEKPL